MRDARTLARLAMDSTTRIADTGEASELPAIVEAIQSFESLPALIDVDEALTSKAAVDTRNWLKAIAIKTWPDFAKGNSEDRSPWLNAVLLALSDLPAAIIAKATRQAVHKPYRFPNEVETEVRRIAADMADKHKLAVFRLRDMKREIEEALNPPTPQIEHQPMEWTQEEVEKANASFKKIGIRTRYRLVCSEVEAFEDEPVNIPVDSGEEKAD